MGQTSEDGPRGGSCRDMTAIPGTSPAAAITKRADCQPKRGPMIPPKAWPAAPPKSMPLAKMACAERSEEHTSELQSHLNLVCRLLLEKKKNNVLGTLTKGNISR